MRCPDCSKFVSLEMGEPEDVELDMDGEQELDDSGELTLLITMNCRIVRNCADCGTEMKEATIESTDNEVLVEHNFLTKCIQSTKKGDEEVWSWKENHGDLTIEENGVESIEEGGGRYAKSYFGATVSYAVHCKCGETLHEGSVSDKVAASAMDEIA